MRRALLALVRRAAGVPTVEARIADLEVRLGRAIAESAAGVRADVSLVVTDQNRDVVRRQALSFQQQVDELAAVVQRGLAADAERSAAQAEAVKLHAQRHAEQLNAHALGLIEERLAAMRVRLDASRSTGAPGTTTGAANDAVSGVSGGGPSPLPDDLYLLLEERFRGGSDEITRRQKEYLGVVAPSVSGEHPAVDLGPGRGEWLRLLAQEGLPCFGVDTNTVFVEQAREAGLDVRQADLVSFLVGAADDSFGAVTLLQVVEHLPLGTVLDVFRHALRTLAPGGVLVVETPNSTNLRVGASTFWLDPTHVRPIHPALLEFLADEVGFASTEILFRNRLGPAAELPPGTDAALADVIGALVEAVDGPGDVVLVARKSPGPARDADALA